MFIKQGIINRRFSIGFINAIAFSLPLFPKFLSPLIVLLVIIRLTEIFFAGERDDLPKKNSFAWLFVSLYLIYFVGMFYSDNKDFGWKDMEMKLSLLLFPLIMFSMPLSFEQRNTIFKSFLWGCLIAVVPCLINASYNYINEQNYIAGNPQLYKYPIKINFFLSSRLSIILHPSYFAMYLNLALGIIMYFWFLNDQHYKVMNNLLLISLATVFIVFIFLLASKSGLVTLSFFFLAFLFFLARKKKKYKEGVVLVLIGLSTFLLLFKLAPEFKNRLKNLKYAITSKNIDKTTKESSAERILIWGASSKIILDNVLFGVGTGDVKDALIKKYEEEGITFAVEKKLNAHNQFLQTAVALGLIGVLILTACLLIPLYKSFKEREFLYVFFLILIIINFLFESMLETQAGVIFYTFFNSLLFYNMQRSSV